MLFINIDFSANNQIKEFHSQLEMKQKLKEESDQHHLEEFQKYLTEQAVYNKERFDTLHSNILILRIYNI